MNCTEVESSLGVEILGALATSLDDLAVCFAVLDNFLGSVPDEFTEIEDATAFLTDLGTLVSFWATSPINFGALLGCWVFSVPLAGCWATSTSDLNGFFAALIDSFVFLGTFSLAKVSTCFVFGFFNVVLGASKVVCDVTTSR